jgi:protein-S-isoprenylcysteine O-methyltransferase Ste14
MTDIPIQSSAGSRLAILSYGVASYGLFFITFLYAIGFVGNFVVPKTIDGEAELASLPALLINLLLLGIFALQHSIMARPAFKNLWLRVVPAAAERTTYVLFSSAALIALFWLWQPMGGQVWSVANPIAQTFLYAGFGFGWGLVLVSTFLINHFDLFGLRQVWLYFRKKPYTELRFVTPWPYRVVRHPLYLGWLFAFWCTPTMTVTHLVFAVMTTGYILIAIQLEERDLIVAHEDYETYKRTVPMIIPHPVRRSSQRATL